MLNENMKKPRKAKGLLQEEPEALNARREARRKRWRIFFILLAAAVVAVVVFHLVCVAFLWGVTEQRAASIGIIGGADGPTAIFVARSPAPLPNWLVLLALAAVAGVGLYCTRQK